MVLKFINMSGDALANLENHPRAVSFDARALVVGGERELLISGEIHYPRVPEGEWERVLDTAKAAGINCIATYVLLESARASQRLL